MIGFLRKADWLNADRARIYTWILGAALLVFTLGAFGTILRPVLSDPHMRPIGADFDAFWSGARLALQGKPGLAYDGASIGPVETEAARLPHDNLLPYLYPPVFLLLCLPLGALPYLVAMPLFLMVGFLANLACLRRILPARWALLPALVLPGAVMNAVIGQNGFLSAVCFGGAMLLLERSPVMAGACLGVFAYKPHLAICIPVALAVAGRFRAFFACAATAGGLMLFSWLVLGSAAWRAFFAASGVLRAVLGSTEVWPKLVSSYAAIRLLHGSTMAAYAGQIAMSLCALACLAWVCARRPGARAEMATLVVAALLCTPYAMDYDLVCLGVPLAWLAGEAVQTGWRDWEKAVLAVCYVLPLFARAFNLAAGLPLAPLAMACLLYVVAARASSDAPRTQKFFGSFFQKRMPSLISGK